MHGNDNPERERERERVWIDRWKVLLDLWLSRKSMWQTLPPLFHILLGWMNRRKWMREKERKRSRKIEVIIILD